MLVLLRWVRDAMGWGATVAKAVYCRSRWQPHRQTNWHAGHSRAAKFQSQCKRLERSRTDRLAMCLAAAAGKRAREDVTTILEAASPVIVRVLTSYRAAGRAPWLCYSLLVTRRGSTRESQNPMPFASLPTVSIQTPPDGVEALLHPASSPHLRATASSLG